MGPVTHAGCGALCPTYNRGCYGCFGPKENTNTTSLGSWFKEQGMEGGEVVRAFRNFNAGSDAFLKESELHEKENP